MDINDIFDISLGSFDDVPYNTYILRCLLLVGDKYYPQRVNFTIRGKQMATPGGLEPDDLLCIRDHLQEKINRSSNCPSAKIVFIEKYCKC